MIEKFNGQDYAIWARHMENILMECDLSKYLNKHDDITDYKEGEDRRALAEIMFTLDKSQMRLVLKCQTANEAWEKLKAKHLHSSESNRIFLKQQFFGLKMKENETMQEFIARIDEMADQLISLDVNDINDESKTIVLLRGVPESYNTSVIVQQETNKLNDYEHVVNSLINEETRRNEKKNPSKDESGEKAFLFEGEKS